MDPIINPHIVNRPALHGLSLQVEVQDNPKAYYSAQHPIEYIPTASEAALDHLVWWSEALQWPPDARAPPDALAGRPEAHAPSQE